MAIAAPFLPYDRLRTIANDFLKKYHRSGDLPVPIERIVEFDFHLDIVPVPGLQEEFDVDAFITNDLSEIRVDKFTLEYRPARYRFSLAHELAHVVIHGDVFKELSFKTISEWKSVVCSIPEDQYFFIEWQAYSLGGLILVPPKPLKDIFDDKCAEAKAAGIDMQDMGDGPRRIIESSIGKHFDVSADVISRRLEYDKLWKLSKKK